MKKTVSMILVFVFIIQFGIVANARERYFNAKVVDYPIYRNSQLQGTEFPILNVQGRTYLSLRDISRILSVEVIWNAREKIIYIGEEIQYFENYISYFSYGGYKKAKEMNFPIYVKGERKYPSNLELLVDARTYLSIRDLANMLAVPIDWNDQSKSIEVGSRYVLETSQEIDEEDYTQATDNYDEDNRRDTENNSTLTIKSENIYRKEQENRIRAKAPINYLPDRKIKNMNFTQEELDYILNDRLNDYEKEMFDNVNKARAREGLGPLKISMELTKVARIHVIDAEKNDLYSEFKKSGGNGHSWSYSNYWTGGVYTPDHKNAQMMWSKPGELTNYTGYGFENSYYGSYVTPDGAVKGWENSGGHNAVMKSQGKWSDIKVVGVGIGNSYACLWFGKDDVDENEGYSK